MHPTAIVVASVDAILGIAILVAREMGYESPPLLTLSAQDQCTIPDGADATVSEFGEIRII
jgi:hypothetical protein